MKRIFSVATLSRVESGFAPYLILFACMASVAGCDRGDTHSHAHEEQTIHVTRWSDRHEVFSEYEPPAVGRDFTFVTHITDLARREPRREGPVTFRFRGPNGSSFEHTDPAPARPGIYLPTIKLPAAGVWSVSVVIPIDESRDTIELGEVRVYASAHDAAHAQPPETVEGISMLKEQQWKIRLQTAPAESRRLTGRLRLSAEVATRPGSSAVAASPVAGRVAAIHGKPIPVPGDRVLRGQVLAMVEPVFSEATARYFEAEANVGRAKAALEQAELNFARTEKLVAENARSQRELQEAHAALATARAEFAAASSLQSAYRHIAGDTNQPAASEGSAIEIRAPMDGVITTVDFSSGRIIEPGAAIFTIANSDVVWLTAHVPDRKASLLQNTRGAIFEIVDSGTNAPFNSARFVFLGGEVSSATRTIPVVFEADNPRGQLRPGQWIELFAAIGEAGESLAIPDAAVVDEGDRPVAFVQVSGEMFEKRELTTGIRDGDWVQVLSGLNPGDRVVVSGAYAVKLASVSHVVPAHGHSH